MWTPLEGCFRKVFIASFRGRSRTPANSKMKFFMTGVNGFQPLTFVPKGSILDVAGVLNQPLTSNNEKKAFLGIFVTYFKVTKQPGQCFI